MAPTPKPEDMLVKFDEAKKLAAEIMKRESELPEMKRKLKEIVDTLVPGETTEVVRSLQKSAGPPEELSGTAKILWVLKANRGTPMDTASISKLIGETDRAYISGMLKRLAEREPEVKKLKRGFFVFEN